MNYSPRNVVAAILLIPTTLASMLLSFLFLVLASVGAPISVLFGIFTVVWAATIAMWCIFLRGLRNNDASSTRPVSRRWRYHLALGAGLAAVGYTFTDPGGAVWQSVAMGWIGLTLAYFCFLLYQSAQIPKQKSSYDRS